MNPAIAFPINPHFCLVFSILDNALSSLPMTIQAVDVTARSSGKLIGKVDFTFVRHCKDCRTIGDSGFSPTNSMTYDPKGVQFTDAEEAKVSHVGSDAAFLQRKLGSESVKTQFSKIYFLQMYFLMAMNSHACLAPRL
jgi:hypothetical protein